MNEDGPVRFLASIRRKKESVCGLKYSPDIKNRILRFKGVSNDSDVKSFVHKLWSLEGVAQWIAKWKHPVTQQMHWCLGGGCNHFAVPASPSESPKRPGRPAMSKEGDRKQVGKLHNQLMSTSRQLSRVLQLSIDDSEAAGAKEASPGEEHGQFALRLSSAPCFCDPLV